MEACHNRALGAVRRLGADANRRTSWSDLDIYRDLLHIHERWLGRKWVL